MDAQKRRIVRYSCVSVSSGWSSPTRRPSPRALISGIRPLRPAEPSGTPKLWPPNSRHQYFRLTVGQTIKTWSLMETVLSVTGLGMVLLLDLVI